MPNRLPQLLSRKKKKKNEGEFTKNHVSQEKSKDKKLPKDLQRIVIRIIIKLTKKHTYVERLDEGRLKSQLICANTNLERKAV